MNKMKKVNFFYIISIFLLFLNVGMVIYYYNLKTSFHVDELFSYGHANSSNGAYLVDGLNSGLRKKRVETYLTNRWFDGQIFHDYLTVQSEEQFNYKHIFKNLEVGVHPPLFYILLHTICSFTPDIFSKWQGAILNILLWVILLIMLYKLSSRFFKDKYLALLPVVFYAFSQIGFNTVLYIRGYLLQTLWAICLIYEAIILLQEKTTSNKRWLLIFLYPLLSMLTHYNSIVYSTIIGIVIGLGLLFQKRYKDIIWLAMTLILSLIALFAIFPEAINVFMHSERADHVVKQGKNILASIKNILYLNGNKQLSNIYMTALWSFNSAHNIIIAEIFILSIFYKYIYTKSRKDVDLLIIIYVLMCSYSDLFMPQMYIYNMRYIMLIMPLLAIYTIWYIIFIMQQLTKRKTLALIILSSMILINSLRADFIHKSPYAFNLEAQDITEINNKKVIWTVPEAVMFFEGIHLLQKTSQTYFIYSHKEIGAEELNKAEYLISFNLDARYDMSLKPQKIAHLEENLQKNLTFIKTFKTGERFYDLYKIKCFESECLEEKQ